MTQESGRPWAVKQRPHRRASRRTLFRLTSDLSWDLLIDVGSRSNIGSRCVRGGSWNNHARNVRCAYRNQNASENRNENLGFRLVRAHDRAWIGPPEQIGFLSVIRRIMAKTKWPPACW